MLFVCKGLLINQKGISVRVDKKCRAILNDEALGDPGLRKRDFINQ